MDEEVRKVACGSVLGWRGFVGGWGVGQWGSTGDIGSWDALWMGRRAEAICEMHRNHSNGMGEKRCGRFLESLSALLQCLAAS